MAEPIYQKIKIAIEEMIADKEPNSPILSERELEKKFNASRMTIRKAIDMLVNEGLLYRVQNVGTFVADSKLHKNVIQTNILNIFSEDDEYKILHFKVKQNAEIAHILEVEDDDPLLQVFRLNLKDGQPDSIDEIYIDKNLCETMRIKDLSNIMQMASTITIGSVNRKFIPMTVPLQYAKLLKIHIGASIICLQSKVNLLDGKVFAYIVSYCSPQKNIEITL